MSHPQQLAFLETVFEARKNNLASLKVLEIGSYDVNGTIRKIFKNYDSYLGVDLVDGPGVDLVAFGHELVFENDSFDVVLSAECFEHDVFWDKTFLNMVRLTKPGGVVAFTCASLGRPEHGTTRANSSLSPGTQSLGLNYYKNLVEQDFYDRNLIGNFFSKFQFYYNPLSWDLYFIGITKNTSGEDVAISELPSHRFISHKTQIMTPIHRMIRWPLRLLLRLLPIEIYNEIAFRYWNLLTSVAKKFSNLQKSL